MYVYIFLEAVSPNLDSLVNYFEILTNLFVIFSICCFVMSTRALGDGGSWNGVPTGGIERGLIG